VPSRLDIEPHVSPGVPENEPSARLVKTRDDPVGRVVDPHPDGRACCRTG
jgi:hypothetical protein